MLIPLHTFTYSRQKTLLHANKKTHQKNNVTQDLCSYLGMRMQQICEHGQVPVLGNKNNIPKLYSQQN